MYRVIVMVFAIIALFIAGCSHGSVTTCETPSNQAISSLPVWVSDYDENNNPAGGLGTLGLFDVHIDSSTLTGEMTSLRSSMSADVLEVVDITNFLQMAPCSDCAAIRGVEINADGNLVVKIGIRHPFEAGDPLKPVSGRNRADLHVFNVEGIVVSDGLAVNSFAGLGVTTGGFSLLNADGYTGYLDGTLDEIFPTDSNIHPFVTHFADYTQGSFDASNTMGFESVTDPPPSGNLVMAMGCDEDIRDYVFDFPEGNIDFIFAIGCTYAVSADYMSMRFTPEYRVPQHNKKAASYVNVVIDSNDLSGGDTASEAQLTIEVLDINHGVAVGTNLDEMRADSSVSAIEIEITSVTSMPVSFAIVPTGGDGRDPANPLTFTGTVLNESGADEGTYTGLVKVTDSYSTGLNESALLYGMDGIKRVGPIETPLNGLLTITEFATYQSFAIDVASGNEVPVAVLKPNPACGCQMEIIRFDGSESYDTDGTVELYEFDFDYDGLNFEADVSGVEAVVDSILYTTGTYTAALRVIDDLGGSNIDTAQVNIDDGGTFDVDCYEKRYVTDTSFSNVVFTPNGFDPAEMQIRQRGLEAMETNSEYIYAVFCATGNDGDGVYLARSGDNGSTWNDYYFVRETTPGATFSGVAIDVVDSEVFIAIGETGPQSMFLLYNSDNGGGTFDEYQLSTSYGHSNISVAVDPVDTNNIYAGVTAGTYFQYTYIYTSNTGPSGPYTMQTLHSWYRPLPYGYYTQAYTTELKVAQDQDVYRFEIGNSTIMIDKSEDFGATFTEIYGTWDPLSYGGRDGDCCFDPNDPETIHWVTTFRRFGDNYHVYRRSTNGGVSWSIRNYNLHNSLLGYTNVSICTDSAANIYMVYGDRTTGNAEIYGRYSDDGGQTLSPVIQISDDPLNDGHVEITPTTHGCDVVIGWLEDRDGERRVVSRRG